MNKELSKSIGTVAREARKALQLTQEDAAERINVSVEFYARIERGTSLPSIGTFARMVSALGVSADALLGRPGAAMESEPLALAWTPMPPSDGPELRRLLRRLRKARPSTLRLVNMLVKELEDSAGSDEQDADSESMDATGEDLEHDEPQVGGGILSTTQHLSYPHEAVMAR